MNVTEAVTSRRSVRVYLDKPVDAAVLRRVLETAQRSPSGGNLQPWNAVVLAGEPLAQLKAAVAEQVARGPDGQSVEYAVYPPDLDGRYRDSRFAVGEAMYAALGIERANKAGRLAQFAANFRAFDAPVLLLAHTPRLMGPPQWADMGMWLQTVMLLLREAGLDSCAQEAWAVYGREVRKAAAIPDHHVFYSGLAIGWRDPQAPINTFAVPREQLDDVVRFEGF